MVWIGGHGRLHACPARQGKRAKVHGIREKAAPPLAPLAAPLLPLLYLSRSTPTLFQSPPPAPAPLPCWQLAIVARLRPGRTPPPHRSCDNTGGPNARPQPAAGQQPPAGLKREWAAKVGRDGSLPREASGRAGSLPREARGRTGSCQEWCAGPPSPSYLVGPMPRCRCLPLAPEATTTSSDTNHPSGREEMGPLKVKTHAGVHTHS